MTTEAEVTCPFCGEQFSVVIDCSIDEQVYVEDCFVCCRPIKFQVICENGDLIQIVANRDD
jgi:hypothetical protein